ncbi:hypothetical protein [Pseudaestuariivita sp.]|uniref:hypothetical protein n=1 Tax=Pseudaestuariivita sp. TaxID=2211669 RepID=UPI00405905E1
MRIATTSIILAAVIGSAATAEIAAPHLKNTAPLQHEAQSAFGCKLYHGTGDCALPEDLGKVRSGALETLANLNLRFIPDSASDKQGVVPRGLCIETSMCTESFLDKEVWCRVALDARTTGWVLKEDANNVYARDGCG